MHVFSSSQRLQIAEFAVTVDPVTLAQTHLACFILWNAAVVA